MARIHKMPKPEDASKFGVLNGRLPPMCPALSHEDALITNLQDTS